MAAAEKSRDENNREDWEERVIALRMERQHLTKPAGLEEYNVLYRDLSPGLNVYWHGFGEPPCLVYRAGFDDLEYNRERQRNRELVKGRFQKGNIGFIQEEDMELFAGLYRKPWKPDDTQELILALIDREGPLNIGLIKEMTGLLVKQITPALHKLQESFVLFEDQFDGEWDREWYRFEEMFPDVDVQHFTRKEALKMVLPRFLFRYVGASVKNFRDFYGIPERELKAAAEELTAGGQFVQKDGIYYLAADFELLQKQERTPFRKILVLHRNDCLVRCEEHHLKQEYKREGMDILQYLLIDGRIRGAVLGHFKYGPYIMEDVCVRLPENEAEARKMEIMEAIYEINGREEPIRRYMGLPV